MQSKAWDRTKRIFSCKSFFEKIDREKLIKKFYVNETDFNASCEPDFVQRDDAYDFEPVKHLIERHGFMSNVPESKRRSLEIMLCKLIEKSMDIID